MFTVGVVLYNKKDYIQGTLLSLLDNADYIAKVIISDNCSTDGSGKIAKQFAEVHSDKFVYLRQDSNIGAYGNFKYFANCNSVETEYFMLMKAQDIIPPNFFEQCRREINANPNCAVYYTDLYFVNGEQLIKFSLPKLENVDAYTRVLSCFNQSVGYIGYLIYGIVNYKVYKESVNRIPSHMHKNGQCIIVHVSDENIYARFLAKGCAGYIKNTFKYKLDFYFNEEYFQSVNRQRRTFQLSLTEYLKCTNRYSLYKVFLDILDAMPVKPDNWKQELYSAFQKKYKCRSLRCCTPNKYFGSILRYFLTNLRSALLQNFSIIEKRTQSRLRVTQNFCDCSVNNIDISQVLADNGIGAIAIYGKRGLGELTEIYLKRFNCDIACFIDRDSIIAASDNTVPVFTIKELTQGIETPNYDAVVVTPDWDYVAICQTIRQFSEAKIVSLNQLTVAAKISADKNVRVQLFFD